MKGIREESQAVLFVSDDIVQLTGAYVDSLKDRARDNESKRARLCAHSNTEDKLHEMLIVLEKSVYIRPHKHLNKSESLHVIEGSGHVVVFDEVGKVTQVIAIGHYSSGDTFYYRISQPYYHTLLVRSDYLVVHEATSGPFRRPDTRFAPWSPDENNVRAAREYRQWLAEHIESTRRVG